MQHTQRHMTQTPFPLDKWHKVLDGTLKRAPRVKATKSDRPAWSPSVQAWRDREELDDPCPKDRPFMVDGGLYRIRYKRNNQTHKRYLSMHPRCLKRKPRPNQNSKLVPLSEWIRELRKRERHAGRVVRLNRRLAVKRRRNIKIRRREVKTQKREAKRKRRQAARRRRRAN